MGNEPSASTDSRSRPETVYVSDSPWRRPTQLFTQMGRDLVAARGLAWRLMFRDLRAQYRQSLLGAFWAVIPPLVTAAGFILAKGAGVFRVGATEIPYPAFVMLSMMLWQTFVEALGAPLQAWTQAKPMLTRINLPREAILLAKLGEVLVNFGVKLILIAGLFMWFRIDVTWGALLALPALLPLILLGQSLGTLLAALGGLYQDVSKGLPFLSLVWLMLTPVVYPIPEVDTSFGWLVRWNPVTPLLTTVRELATTGNLTDPTAYWVAVLFTVFCLILAWFVFRIATPFVIERMSS